MIKDEYSQLKKIIVGREYDNHFYERIYNKRTSETNKEFEKFYQVKAFDHIEYSGNCEICLKDRQDDLDNLSNVLEEEGIEVLRPQKKLAEENQKYFAGSNVRDIMFTIDNYLIITNSPLSLRRYEYLQYKEIIKSSNKDVIQIPFLKANYDYKEYSLDCELSEFADKGVYYPVFDAANIIKHNGELIMNICNRNEYAGYEYLKRILNVIIHPVFIDHHHIDGALNIINDKLALVCYDSRKISKEKFIYKLPSMIQKMELIHIDKNPDAYDSAKNRVIASVGGMFINIISINPKTVISNDKAWYVNSELEKRGIRVIKIRFKDARLFGGGIHCTTLDLERDTNSTII